jgi:hypothetical protein
MKNDGRHEDCWGSAEIKNSFAPALAVPLTQGDPLPARIGVGSHLDQRRQALPFLPRAAFLMRTAGWSRFVQRRIQAKSGNNTNWPGQVDHPPQQRNHGKNAIGDHDQLPRRQPAMQLEMHLPGPIGQLLVRPLARRIESLGGGQDRQERQGRHPRGAQVIGGNSAKLNQRRPLALTKCPWLDRTGSRQMPLAMIFAPRRRSMVSSITTITGPVAVKVVISTPINTRRNNPGHARRRPYDASVPTPLDCGTDSCLARSFSSSGCAL